jgi:hypothetical protein
VRDLIEETASADLEQGIQIGYRTKDGAQFRAPGGDRERAIAANFRKYADALQSKWFRTAAMLREMATSYEREAKMHDDRKDRQEFS